jgi:hypothetical protein
MMTLLHFLHLIPETITATENPAKKKKCTTNLSAERGGHFFS